MNLSSAELRILQDTTFLQQKRLVTEKLHGLFKQLAHELRDTKIHQTFPFPVATDSLHGKISKGENYKGLPYMVLDFPKLFQKTDIFTFRSMCWWGNEWTCSLHLGGRYMRHFLEAFLKNKAQLHDQGVFFAIAETPWHYHFSKSTFLPIEEMTLEAIRAFADQHHFIKISRRLSLSDWEQFLEFGTFTYTLFLQKLLL